jgi:ribosomal protein L3
MRAALQGNREDAPTRPAGATGDVEMGIVPPATEPTDKHMEEFFKEVSLIKVTCFTPGKGRGGVITKRTAEEWEMPNLN